MDTSKILKNYAMMSVVNRDFFDFAYEQGKVNANTNLLDGNLPLIVRHYPYALSSWPVFISDKFKSQMSACTVGLLPVMYSTLKLEFDNCAQSFADFFNTDPRYFTDFLNLEFHLDKVVQRSDVILTSDGLKVIELNIGSNVGGWQIQFIEQQYQKVASLKQFLNDKNARSRNIMANYFESLLDHAIFEPCTQAKAMVLFVVPPEYLAMDIAGAFEPYFKAVLTSRGMEGELKFVTNLDELQVNEHALWYEKQRVSTLLLAHGVNDKAKFDKILEVYRQGGVYWPDNPFYCLFRDKGVLALLYKHRDNPLLSAAERDYINQYISPSFLVNEQEQEYRGHKAPLLQHLLHYKNNFVIKHRFGAQGKEVYLGKEVTLEKWKSILDKALQDGKWLAQELSESISLLSVSKKDNTLEPHNLVWGVFCFGARYGGCWTRQINEQTGVINSDNAAIESVVYEV